MIGVLLALGAACAYGLSDFVAGVASRRSSAWATSVAGQFAAMVLVWVVVPFDPGAPGARDLAWAAAAGVGNAVGTAFLYRGFAVGRIAVVAPISAVFAALLPLAAGVVVGERPSVVAWLGVAAALPGIWLVSRAEGGTGDDGAALAGAPAREGLGASVRDGTLAGLGFGLTFAGLGQVPDAAGLVPLGCAQIVAVLGVVALAALLGGGSWRPRWPQAGGGLVAGALGGSSTLLYLLSVHAGSLTTAAILTSLYPAGTIVLAALILHERIHAAQGVGLALCGVAVGLVAAG